MMSSGANWTFSTPGTYQVALRVTDNQGNSDLSVLQVEVSGPAEPTADAGPAPLATGGQDSASH